MAAMPALAANFGVKATASLTAPDDPTAGGCIVFGSGGLLCSGATSRDHDDANVYQEYSGQARLDDHNADAVAQAYADLDTLDGLPFLAAYARAGEREYARASVEAVREFVYTGADPFTFVLDAAYSSLQQPDPASDNPLPGTYMDGVVAIIVDDPADPVGSDIEAAFVNDFALGGSVFIGVNSTDREFGSLDNGSGAEDFALSVSAELKPGDRFFVYNAFTIGAVNGAVTDGLASATLSANTLDFIAAELMPVPVPASIGLLTVAIASLAVVSRRRPVVRAERSGG